MSQQLLTEEQVNLLKELKLYEPELQFRSLTEISFPQQLQNPQLINEKQRGSKNYMRPIFNHLQSEDDFNYNQIKNKLLKYRQRSQQIYQVGEFIKQYQQGFNMLVKQKDQLVRLLQDLKGQTSQIVNKQKKLIDLSIGIKERLQYYDFHAKFSFDWPCEISIRQMFQDKLQSTLSSIMDGIQFFSENTNYASSKKYLGAFITSRSKVLSFIKSFFIKLFSKQNAFVSKYYNSQALCRCFDSLYTKSKLNFVTPYLVCFPQFKRQLKHAINFAKDQTNLQQQKIKFLETRQVQIQEFCLSEHNISLIRYMQKHNNQIYSEVVLNLTSFNRFSLHENLINFSKRHYDSKSQTQNLRNKYVFFIEDLIKYLREIKFKNPFQLCETINIVHEQLPNSIKKLQSGEYQLYIMGNLLGLVTYGENIEYLLQIFNSSYQRIINQLQVACFNSLPKLTLTNNLQKVQENICILIQHIPKLKYCKVHQENYMISSLDAIVKSIREVNSAIPSRYECFAWNLIIFGSIKNAIKNLGFSIVRKQLRLDVNQSINIMDKVRSVERTENLLKYAQDILNVIVTGIPTVNQLTLDFVKYINEHCQQLQTKFVKDNLFIYGKNMVQFLQHFNQIQQKNEQDKDQKLKKLCNPKTMKSLYNGYILSIQKFILQSKQILNGRSKSRVPYLQINMQVVKGLIKQIYQKLIDFLDTFYVEVSQASQESTVQFQEISRIKKRHIQLWDKIISFE